MATASLPSAMPIITLGTSIWPWSFRMTGEVFERLRYSGWVEGRKLILIEGQILELAFPTHKNDVSLCLTGDWLRTVFPTSEYCIRSQMGLFIGTDTNPVPDLLVVSGTPRNHDDTPKNALLLIEVADTSLAFDSKDKASLYAAARIEDYWVIDVDNRRLFVFRNPIRDQSRRYGFWYDQVTVLNPTDTVAALAAPNSPVIVGELLP